MAEVRDEVLVLDYVEIRFPTNLESQLGFESKKSILHNLEFPSIYLWRLHRNSILVIARLTH